MFLIALTGGIAAGKSTVAAVWAALGAVEIDADAIAREVVKPGTAGLVAVVAAFGPEIMGATGALDRNRLGQIVFSDPAKRKQLEEILHPLISVQTRALIAQQPIDAMVVYNVPLLVEANVNYDFDRVVTVEAPVDEQIDRLIKYRGMTEQEARQRIAAQASSAARANRADFILNSNQSIDELRADATRLWRQFEAEASAKH